MFRKQIFVIVAAILVALFVSSAYSAESNMVQANNFLKAGRTAQAIEALEKEIAENSNNAEAYFKLGLVYFQDKSYDRAEKEFNSAYNFKKSYGPEIAKKFLTLGQMNLPEYAQARKFFSFAEKYGASSEQTQKLLRGYGESVLANAGNRDQALKAVSYIGEEKINAKFPPKQWVTVFDKTFTGKGYGQGDDGSIVIATVGKDLLFEDRITIIGEEFEVWYANAWNKHYKERQVINKYSGSSGTYDLKAPEGATFKVRIERFMYPSEKGDVAALSLNQ